MSRPIDPGPGNTGIGTPAPKHWLHLAGVGAIKSPPNWWRRFWCWALLGWTWEVHR